MKLKTVLVTVNVDNFNFQPNIQKVLNTGLRSVQDLLMWRLVSIPGKYLEQISACFFPFFSVTLKSHIQCAERNSSKHLENLQRKSCRICVISSTFFP